MPAFKPAKFVTLDGGTRILASIYSPKCHLARIREVVLDGPGYGTLSLELGGKMMVLEVREAAALSRLFSPGVVRDFSRSARSPLFVRLLRSSSISERFAERDTVGDALNYAFRTLSKSGSRSDYVYRSALTEKILLGRHSLRTATMLHELRSGRSKADVVVLNGTSTAYEIKSERDSLSRLSAQLDDYRSVFGSVNVVTAESHLHKVLEVAPEDVGVITLSGRRRLQTARPARDLPGRVDPSKILDILQVDEAIEIVKYLGGRVPTVPNTRLRHELKSIFSVMKPAVAHNAMVQTLRVRRSQSRLSSFLDEVPFSLRSASLAAKPSQKDQKNILKAVRTPLQHAFDWE